MAASNPITADELRSLLSYDEASGEFRWRFTTSSRAKAGQVAGTTDIYGYTVIRVAGRGYKAHRLAWLYVYGHWPASLLDHINQNKQDNRIANLRQCDDSLNQMNISVPQGQSRSGVRGVSWFSQYGKWKATIMFRGRKHFLGHFDTVDEAAAAYAAAKARVTAGAWDKV